jgi:hypothetical protein
MLQFVWSQNRLPTSSNYHPVVPMDCQAHQAIVPFPTAQHAAFTEETECIQNCGWKT